MSTITAQTVCMCTSVLLAACIVLKGCTDGEAGMYSVCCDYL